MGLRFQKRIKFGKFFTLNLSKSGVSGSVGVEGAQVTVGHGKIRKTVGLSGTGLSYSTVKSLTEKNKNLTEKSDKYLKKSNIKIFYFFIFLVIFFYFILN